MWRLPSLVLLALLLSTSAFGQTSTTVSGTITDSPDGQAWFGGTFSFVFRTSPSNPTAQYFWNGVPFSSAQTIAGALDGSAHYSVSVPSNTSITPAGSTWDLTVCPLATASCLTVQSITITGGTQTVAPIPASIRINLSSPPLNPKAYTDTEVVSGSLGQTYFNLVSTVIRVCSVFPCGWTNSSGGTSITLQTNSVVNPVQSLLNIKAGTAITTTSDGSGGVTIASTIGPPCGTAGVVQAANGTGGSQCTSVTEANGVLTVAEDVAHRGPNLGVDITSTPFNARALSTSAIPLTTGTITGGTNSLVVGSNTGWQKNDGFALQNGGATNCATPPAAPTGFAGLASSMTGTGHAVAGDTGATSYSYVVSAISKGGCVTAASPILTIANGNATLGATNLPITSCVNVSGLVTCTMGSTTALATGMWTRIGGTTDDGEFGGRHNITVLNGTQFTYQSSESSLYPMFSTTATGGTLYFWPTNHIVLPTLPAGTNLYKYAVWRCTGASCALPANAANYSLVYISYPANLGFIDAAYNTWDDYGSISTLTSSSTPWFIPTTPPATNTNDMLVTTITNIAGTTFTLAANAINSTASASMRFDDVPAFTACQAASNSTSAGGGGACHVPPALETGSGGVMCYITSSYFVINSVVNVGGTPCFGETVELSGSRGALMGMPDDTIHSITTAFDNQTQLTVLCNGANPCIWRKGPPMRNLLISSSGPSAMLVFDSSPNQTLTENVHFNVSDGMGISYEAYGAIFGAVFNNTGWTAGPTQTIGLIDTPAYINRDSIQTTFNNVSGNLRGLYWECTNNPPNSCEFYITVRMGNEWQGPITPIVTVNATSGGRNGWIWLEHMIQDSGAESIFANASNAGALLASVIINGTNQPGKDPGAPIGGNQPIITGNQTFGGISVLTDSPLITSIGTNHDLFQCPQPTTNQPAYRGCILPSLNLTTATYGVNHTLNASEGIVKALASGITFTLPHALAGQTWQVLNPSSGTITLAIDSGTLSGNGATGPITVQANSGGVASCDGTNCSAFGFGGGGGGGSPGGTTNATQYNGGGGSFGAVNSPVFNGNYNVHYRVTASASVPPAIDNPGIPINVQTGTTYTIGTANTDFDRGYVITANNAGAQTYTFVNPSTAGYGFNHFFVIKNIGTGTVTATASGFTINGAASLLIAPSWTVFFWSDGVNYFASRLPDFTAFPNCVGGGNALQFTTATGVFSCGSSSAGVSSVTGDGIIFSNSLSTGAVTLTLVSGGANKVLANCTGSPAAPTYCSITGAMLPATVMQTNQINTLGAFNQDFSLATWKWPTAAGFTASATSMSGYDSTAKIPHCYVNNADGLCATTTSTSTTVTQVLHATATPGIYAPSAVVTADLPAQYTKLECSPGLGDGLNVITAGTYLQFNCVNKSGVTWTITGISCWTDNAGTSTLNAANNAATGLLTGAVTCNNTKSGGGAAGTQSGTTTLANNDAISFTFVADGTSKQTTWTITLTQ